MANSGSFSLVIHAKDEASARIDAINKRIAAMQAPANRAQASLKRFANLTGFTETTQRMEDFRKSVVSVAGELGKLPPIFGAATGAGAAAAVVGMTREWARWGTTLHFTAQRAGVSVERLQEMQGAARLAGSSAEAMSSGIVALRENLVNAVGGRAPQFVAMMGALGLAWRNADGSARKVADVLPEITARIGRMSEPTLRLRAATALFGGAAEDLLPLLSLGAQRVAALEREARTYGLTTQDGTSKAVEFSQATARLELATEGFAHALSERVSPALITMQNSMADAVAKSFTPWAQHVTATEALMEGFLTYMETVVGARMALWLAKQSWMLPARALPMILTPLGLAIGAGAATFLEPALNPSTPDDSTEGRAFRRALRENFNRDRLPGVAAARPAPMPSGGLLSQGIYRGGFGNVPPDLQELNDATPALSTREMMANARESQRLLVQRGYSAAQAAGIVANFNRESGMNPRDVGDGGAAFGIGQWHRDRQAAFRLWSGHDIRISTLAEQVAFFDWDSRHGPYAAAGDAIRAARTAGEAARAMSLQYERPGDADGEARRRAAEARDWQLYFSQHLAGAAAPPLSIAGGAGASAGGAAAGGTLNATVTFQNAPAGTRATVRTTGNVLAGPPRVVRAFPDVTLP